VNNPYQNIAIAQDGAAGQIKAIENPFIKSIKIPIRK
jgi:hypothetical protein